MNIIKETIKCSVCDKDFLPPDDFEFVCGDCQKSLVGHCDCGGDDVKMDWQVELDSVAPYYWEIVCSCGKEVKSRPHFLLESDDVAKELYSEWMKR